MPVGKRRGHRELRRNQRGGTGNIHELRDAGKDEDQHEQNSARGEKYRHDDLPYPSRPHRRHNIMIELRALHRLISAEAPVP